MVGQKAPRPLRWMSSTRGLLLILAGIAVTGLAFIVSSLLSFENPRMPTAGIVVRGEESCDLGGGSKLWAWRLEAISDTPIRFRLAFVTSGEVVDLADGVYTEFGRGGSANVYILSFRGEPFDKANSMAFAMSASLRPARVGQWKRSAFTLPPPPSSSLVDGDASPAEWVEIGFIQLASFVSPNEETIKLLQVVYGVDPASVPPGFATQADWSIEE